MIDTIEKIIALIVGTIMIVKEIIGAFKWTKKKLDKWKRSKKKRLRKSKNKRKR